jgi:isoamylase
MLLGGDEQGRTQGGNNNAYCQDNAISWFDWDNVDAELLAYTAGLIALRHDHPALRRRRYVSGARPGEVVWFSVAGAPMTDADWASPLTRSVAVLIDGGAKPDRDERGRPMTDDDLLALINGGWEPVRFRVPPPPGLLSAVTGMGWRVELDTSTGSIRPADPAVHGVNADVTVEPRALVLLASHRSSTAQVVSSDV